jgi:hypothetical protein
MTMAAETSLTLRRQNAELAQLSFLMSKPDILKLDRAPFVVASSSHEMI